MPRTPGDETPLNLRDKIVRWISRHQDEDSGEDTRPEALESLTSEGIECKFDTTKKHLCW